MRELGVSWTRFDGMTPTTALCVCPVIMQNASQGKPACEHRHTSTKNPSQNQKQQRGPPLPGGVWCLCDIPRYDLWFVFIKYLHVIMYKFSRPRKWCLNVLAPAAFSRETLRTFFEEEVVCVLRGCPNTFGRHCNMADSETERTRETARSSTAIN